MSRPFQPGDRQIFITGVVVAILISVILALAGEWMLIAVLVALIFAYYVWTNVPPEETEYVITTKGVRMHGQIYLWQELTRWWVEEKWGHKILSIDAPVSFPKRLHLVMGSVDEAKLTEVMGKHLVLEAPIDTPMDRAGRWLVEKFPLSSR